MQKMIPAVAVLMSVVACAGADQISDPFGMQTRSVDSQASYFIFSDQHSSVFTPASSAWECSESMVGAANCATMEVINQACQTSSNGAESDRISFEWSNLNLYSPFGFTAAGSASTSFSLEQNANLSMVEMSNIGSLSAQASWAIRLYDDENQLLGSLDELGDSYVLEAERTYSLSFLMGGSDTRSASGALVGWDITVDYLQPPPAVVPGFGGLALFASCGIRRRKRKR